MVTAQFEHGPKRGVIVASPNHSWTWRANTYFVYTLLGISMTIALPFTWAGYWLILPFTVLEMGVLLLCLHICVARSSTQEVLTFTPEHLVLETGIRRVSQRTDLVRFFARFRVEPARHPWYRKTINLDYRGKSTEIGRYLSDEDKDRLIEELRAMVHQLEGCQRKRS